MLNFSSNKTKEKCVLRDGKLSRRNGRQFGSGKHETVILQSTDLMTWAVGTAVGELNVVMLSALNDLGYGSWQRAAWTVNGDGCPLTQYCFL